jgi:hypothetical protein
MADRQHTETRGGFPAAIERLFESQIDSWPMLARGVEALAQVQTRSERVNAFDVVVRHLPHRIVSTTAAVDRASIQKRPCFLCAANLPPEEKGIVFNSEFSLYCNPFPILDRHLTIVHNDHRPQRISGQLENMRAIADALPGYFVIYNGPECGASAPDHLHFQACATTVFPIASDLKKRSGRTIPNYARHVLVLDNVQEVQMAMDGLNTVAPRDPEPLLNIAACRAAGSVRFLVFPRSKHRPEAFHTGEFTVSPATIDLCGVLVTPVEKDFRNIRGEDIRRIFEEVTLNDELFGRLTALFQNSHEDISRIDRGAPQR